MVISALLKLGSSASAGQNQNPFGRSGGVNMEDLFAQFSGGGGGGGGFGQGHGGFGHGHHGLFSTYC